MSDEIPRKRKTVEELKMRGWMLKPAMYQSNFRENPSIFSSAKSQTKIETISQTTEGFMFHAIYAKSQTNFDLDLA
eukprot:scaffold3191_cov97-Isochrysis_galbana.AAC.2